MRDAIVIAIIASFLISAHSSIDSAEGLLKVEVDDGPIH